MTVRTRPPCMTGSIMNPPFNLERDIDHVMHALEFLKTDGYLIAIMSAGTEFRETAKSRAFRDRMKNLHAQWKDLPPESFSSVGTYVNARLPARMEGSQESIILVRNGVI